MAKQKATTDKTEESTADSSISSTVKGFAMSLAKTIGVSMPIKDNLVMFA